MFRILVPLRVVVVTLCNTALPHRLGFSQAGLRPSESMRIRFKLMDFKICCCIILKFQTDSSGANI